MSLLPRLPVDRVVDLPEIAFRFFPSVEFCSLLSLRGKGRLYWTRTSVAQTREENFFWRAIWTVL